MMNNEKINDSNIKELSVYVLNYIHLYSTEFYFMIFSTSILNPKNSVTVINS